MDIDFKDILSKLSVFKNNLSLLVPIIIALVSVLLFIPTHLLGSKLRSQVQAESLPKWRDIENIKRNPVESFTEESIEARKQAHAADANEIIALAAQTTLRELLSYDIFPEPDPNKGVSGLTFVEFGRRYRSGIEKLITGVRGGSCLTDVEIQNGLEDSAARMNRRPGMGMGMAGGGSPYDMGGAGPRRLGMVAGMPGPRNEIDTMIIDQMCEERARSLSVYVNPIDVAGYDHWADYKFDPNMIPAVKDAWYHQLAYWVIEDTFNTIDTMNSEHDILSAPVKRLVRLSFTMGLKRPGSRGSSTAVIRRVGRARANTTQDEGESDRPAYVIEDKHGLTESLTARYADSKSAIDVIHFNVAVVVATRDILPFMQQLCSSKDHKFSGYPDGSQPEQTFKHNQITILEFKSGAVNEYDPVHRYHSYGDDSVVMLDLICEYIFYRKALDPIIMPKAVIEELDSIEAGA